MREHGKMAGVCGWLGFITAALSIVCLYCDAGVGGVRVELMSAGVVLVFLSLICGIFACVLGRYVLGSFAVGLSVVALFLVPIFAAAYHGR